jgi:transcriptional regulator NrdR family protein
MLEFKRNQVSEEILKMMKSCKEVRTFGYNDFSKSYVYFKNLPKIVAEIEELKNKHKTKGNNG